MRISVISDTHGNAAAFEAVIQDMKRQSPDAVVFLGDAVMRGPQPSECVELLRSLNCEALVRGNYDHIFTRYPASPDWKPETFKDKLKLRAIEYDQGWLSQEEQLWLAHLPVGKTWAMPEIQIEMYHAAPDSLGKVTYPWAPLEELDKLHRHDTTGLVLYGHIHHAYVRQAMGRTVVNCGSVGLPFDRDNRASYAIVDIAGGDISVQLRRVSYDIEKAIRIAKERSMPDADLFEYALRKALYPYYEEIYDKIG
ncbi:metallophosphoesterase family protein [Paenibacillus piri]|uniref:Metallophosphoesterase n=1 Tax=Paenibacillus piri TaxID=2547395 RepID=A0A4R5KV95_9BACL|nr:metallophosphoesterase family protein [Paenibacillus piri]TDF99656.1 metallophosphoesterase [Paenibacillus piri]